jgi:hypothetical protein
MPQRQIASKIMISQIERQFDNFNVSYFSENFGESPNFGSRCMAHIECRDGDKQVGAIKFFDREPAPSNSYHGSHPYYIPVLNFHISRFNDIINILRYQKPLSIWFDFNRLDGALTSPIYETIGQEE